MSKYVGPPTAFIDGKKVQKIRLQKGITEETLATMAGVAAYYVTRWERDGIVTCSFHTADRVAVALGIPLEEVIHQFTDDLGEQI